MTDNTSGTKSPGWGWTTKLVVGLTIVAIVAAFVIRFRNFIGPIILAAILSWFLTPTCRGILPLTPWMNKGA